MKMLAAFSPGSDFKRYYRGRLPRLALAVIVAMPLLYGALYLWAFWNPFAAADKMPVAIVNSDVGAVVDGQPLQAGAQVAQGLIDSGQLDLHLVSEQEAADGVAHGKFYFSITLPEDFSEALASPASGTPRSAELIFTYNDANNYLATVIGQDAAEQVVVQVGAQVGAQTFEIVFQQIDPMIGKVTEAADGASELADGLGTAKSGADQLNSGIQELTNAVMSATDRVLGFVETVEGSVTPTEVNETVGRVTNNVNELNSALALISAEETEAHRALSAVRDELRRHPDPRIQAFAGLLEPVISSVAPPPVAAGLGPTVQGKLDALETDTALLAAQLNNPNSPLHQAINLLESGNLVGDIGTLRSGVTQLSNGSTQLAGGLGELSGGATQLADGLEEGAAAIPHWTPEQQDALAKVLAQPVVLSEVYHNQADTFGDGFAPFFFGLALFVGSIIAWMLFTPLQSRPIAHGLGSVRVILASYAPTFAVGFLQALLLYLVTVFAIGMRPVHPLGTFGFMLLMVAMFLAMIQMFNAVFGTAVGRVLTLAFLMVQLTSAGGIYPVETTTKPFQYIHWVDPMTYTVNGLRQLTVGGIDYRLPVAIAVIIGLTLVFLSISTWAAHRNRQYNMDRLYPPVEV